VVLGLDPNDVVFVHKEHGFDAVFSFNIGHDNERVIGLCEKIGHSCFDADVDFPFPCDPIGGFDPDPSVFFLVNVFALLQGSSPPSKRYPPTIYLRAEMDRHSFKLHNSLIYLGFPVKIIFDLAWTLPKVKDY
jgi:hypothetical protein